MILWSRDRFKNRNTSNPDPWRQIKSSLSDFAHVFASSLKELKGISFLAVNWFLQVVVYNAFV